MASLPDHDCHVRLEIRAESREPPVGTDKDSDTSGESDDIANIANIVIPPHLSLGTISATHTAIPTNPPPSLPSLCRRSIQLELQLEFGER